MSQETHDRPAGESSPGQQQQPATPPRAGGCSGTGTDSVLRELRQREQRRAAEHADDDGRPQ